MSTPERTSELVLASGNVGKIREFQQLLTPLGWTLRAQSDFDTPEAAETGLSFVENAIIKARNAASYSGLPALADDSGLEVDALKGAPGIYSARYAGPENSDQANNQKLLAELAAVSPEQRTARFQCVLAFMRHDQDPTPLICQASWEGYIVDLPKGNNGFGYDPLFYIPALDCCSAQLAPEQKNKLSHRAKAMAILLKQLGG
jgi:XTP/dITP diphosphohydrolase